ncbi:unnamed protein product [Brassica oleracea var. botrytis]
MGSSEMKKRSKENEPKTPPPPPSSPAPVVTSQEPSSSSAVSAGMATPDWSGFQAYSPMPPHGYVASSPQPHLYMWGVQHMMMPPYGTPPPPMYPPGGMYGHPSSLPPGSYPYSPYGMAEASGNTEGGGSKQAEVKEKLPIKRSKGSLGSLNMIIGKNNDTGKNSCSKRHVTSRYAESASDGSSEGNDADSQNDSGSRNNGKDASDSAHGPLRAHGSNQPANQIVPIIAYRCSRPTNKSKHRNGLLERSWKCFYNSSWSCSSRWLLNHKHGYRMRESLSDRNGSRVQ